MTTKGIAKTDNLSPNAMGQGGNTMASDKPKRAGDKDMAESAKNVAAKLPTRTSEDPAWMSMTQAEEDALSRNEVWEAIREIGDWIDAKTKEVAEIQAKIEKARTIESELSKRTGMVPISALEALQARIRELESRGGSSGASKGTRTRGANVDRSGMAEWLRRMKESVKGSSTVTKAEAKAKVMERNKTLGPNASDALSDEQFELAWAERKQIFRPAPGSSGKGPKATWTLI